MVDFLVQQVSTIPVVCLFHIKYFKWYVIGNKVNKSKKTSSFFVRRKFQFDGSDYLPEAPPSVSFLRASDLQFALILKKKIDQLNH